MSASERRTLLLLAAMWGGSFVFIRVASPVFGPVIMVEMRVLFGGLLLAAYGALSGSDLGLRKHFWNYCVLGLLNSAMPFMLVSTAELRIDASMTVLLNATSPLGGAIVAAIFLGEPLTLRKIAGIGVAFSGVVALVGLSPVSHDTKTLMSIGACLLAASSYGFSGAYIKRKMADAPPIGLAAGSMLTAAIMLAPFAATSHMMRSVTVPALLSISALTVLCTTVAYIMYFNLIKSAGPAKALSVTFLTPVFGLIWGAVCIGDRITPIKLGACAIILAGTALMLSTQKKLATAVAEL
jgi:drug/metabolite transporter (DMT)-like permease